MTGDSVRENLDARVLEWMREPEPAADDARFETLALAIFAHQFAHCAPYRRFCEGRGRTPETVREASEIPTVPTGAFKELELRSFPAPRTVHTFRTSGTSSEARGALHLDTLALYEASLLPSFRRFVLPDLPPGEPTHLRALAPSPVEAPDSSLSHMLGRILAELGSADSGFDVRGGELDVGGVIRSLESACRSGEPLALLGTAFAFVHLVDALAGRGAVFSLPGGSRVMETGGFKGRSRELPRDALYESIERALGIPPPRIVNQYGMTELGSQFHDSVLAFPDEARRKLGPPWARVRLVDPYTGDTAAPGEIGTICVLDLANTGSVIAIETADLGRALDDGFEVLGRDPGAEQRGCSIAADELLGGRV